MKCLDTWYLIGNKLYSCQISMMCTNCELPCGIINPYQLEFIKESAIYQEWKAPNYNITHGKISG